MKWYQHPLLHTMLLTIGTAVWIDISSWKSWDDARFNLKTASWRWAKGALVGFFGYFGLTTGANAAAQ